MYCIYCGSKSERENNFCVQCGKPMAHPDFAEAEPAPAPQPAQGVPDSPPVCEDLPDTPADTGMIVRQGAWMQTTDELVREDFSPAPVLRRWQVLLPCGLIMVLSIAVFLLFLMADDITPSASPVFSVFLAAGLGIAAIVLFAAMLIVVFAGRTSVPEASRGWPDEAGFATSASTDLAAAPRVALTDASRPEQIFYLTLAQPVEIGREVSAGDVEIPYEKSISKRHCRLYASGREVVLEDLGGKNGTFLNGAAVTAPTVLASGDQLTLGRLTLHVAIAQQE